MESNNNNHNQLDNINQSSAVCTLFEKHYHLGVAALINSLYSKGFRGSFYAGYKGSLPEWSSSAKPDDSLNWKGATTMQIGEGMKIHFLPVEVQMHFANYKPEFMLDLWKGPAVNEDYIAYYDPDIVVKCNWSFMVRWMSYGVALVHEIINHHTTASHPTRMGWEEVISKAGLSKTRILNHYFNAGFYGVAKKNLEFLEVWSTVLKTAMKDFDLHPFYFLTSTDRADHFNAGDQDAMNIAAMCCKSPLSEIGPEGMDFIPGGWIMSHATSAPKPWKKNFLISALKGIGPSVAEKGYWNNLDGPLKPYSQMLIKRKKACIKIAAFIGRFYGKR